MKQRRPRFTSGHAPNRSSALSSDNNRAQCRVRTRLSIRLSQISY